MEVMDAINKLSDAEQELVAARTEHNRGRELEAMQEVAWSVGDLNLSIIVAEGTFKKIPTAAIAELDIKKKLIDAERALASARIANDFWMETEAKSMVAGFSRCLAQLEPRKHEIGSRL